MDKDSALLEYPGETSSSLVADHHGMSKFKNATDTNYINVKNVLRWLMKKIMSKETAEQGKFLGPLSCFLCAESYQRADLRKQHTNDENVRTSSKARK